MYFEVEVENRAAPVFFLFHSVDTAAGVDGHLRFHRSLLMEWPNNSRIAPAADFEPPAALPRRSVTRPHFFSRYIRHGFMASAIRSCQLIATDVQWRPRQ